MKINRLLPLAAVLAMGFALDTSAQEITVNSGISGAVVMRGSAGSPAGLTTGADNSRRRAQEETADQTEPTFEVRDDVGNIAYTDPYAVNLLYLLNVDPSLDVSRIHIECNGPVDISYGDNAIYGIAFETGTFTFTVTSEEIPDKTLEFDLTFIPPYPDRYALRNQDNSYTGLTLTRANSDSQIYTGTITVPEGDDDFVFYLDGPEEFAGCYVLGGTGDVFDLSQETSTVSTTGLNYFLIPAEYRGQTYDFRLNRTNETLTISQQGYVRDYTFELREERPAYCKVYTDYILSEFVNLDSDLSLMDINVASDGPVEVLKDAWNIILRTNEPGTYSITLTTDEVPGKEIVFEVTFLSLYPSEYILTAVDGTRTDLVLPLADNNRYSATLTIPEGEGDFPFFLNGSEEYGNLYRMGGDGSAIDLSQETCKVNAGAWSENPFVIPAEYRGQSFDFKYNAMNSVLEINHEGYVRPLTFEWIDADAPIAARLGSWISIWPYEYIRIDDEINVDDIFITIEPEQEGIQMQGSREFVVSEDYSGPAELTIKVTTPELQERGVVLEKTLKIIPQRPAEIVFVSGGARVGETSLLPDAGEPWKFNGSFTIPEGEGDFSFRLADADLTGFYNYGNYENINLTQGVAQVNMWDGNTDEVTVPAEFRGQTYNFSFNFYDNNTLTIAKEGYDVDALTVTPDETNPSEVVYRHETAFYFNVTGLRPEGLQFRIDGEGVYITEANPIEWDTERLRYIVRVMPEVEGSFTLVAFKDLNGTQREYYSKEFSSNYVAIENFTAPATLVLHEGEFSPLAAEISPAAYSPSVFLQIDNYEDGIIGTTNSDDRSMLVLGHKAGIKEIRWMCDDMRGNTEELGTTTVTVLPREAVEAEHIFHASLGVGEEMTLRLSAHKDRSFAEATWTSSDPEIVSVDENGTVHAHADGTALITADCGEHQSYMGIIAGNGTTEVENPGVTAVRAYGRDGVIYVTGAPEGTAIRVFDAAGKTRATKTANGSADKFAVGSGVFVVSAGNEVFKLAL